MTKTLPPGLAGFDELPDIARVREPVVRALFGGISPSTLLRRMDAGAIPRPRKQFGSNTWGVGELRKALTE